MKKELATRYCCWDAGGGLEWKKREADIVCVSGIVLRGCGRDWIEVGVVVAMAMAMAMTLKRWALSPAPRDEWSSLDRTDQADIRDATITPYRCTCIQLRSDLHQPQTQQSGTV